MAAAAAHPFLQMPASVRLKFCWRSPIRMRPIWSLALSPISFRPAPRNWPVFGVPDFDQYHETFREQVPHIDTVINPEIEVVKTIEGLMRVPGAVDVGEFADGRIKFVGVYLEP